MSDTFYLVVEIYNRAPKPTEESNNPCPCGSGKKYRNCCGAPKAIETPKRNDECPCRSGKKFKKCHGADIKIGIPGLKAFERVKIVDSLTKSILSSATVIIDVLNRKCVINNLTKAPEEEVIGHYLKANEESVNRAAEVWMRKQTKKFINTPEYQREIRKIAEDRAREARTVAETPKDDDVAI